MFYLYKVLIEYNIIMNITKVIILLIKGLAFRSMVRKGSYVRQSP